MTQWASINSVVFAMLSPVVLLFKGAESNQQGINSVPKDCKSLSITSTNNLVPPSSGNRKEHDLARLPQQPSLLRERHHRSNEPSWCGLRSGNALGGLI